MQHCRTCDHDKILEINDDLFRKTPYNIVSDKYNLPYGSIRRHALNHLQLFVQRQKGKYLQELRAKQELKSTLEKVDELLTGSDPNLIQQMTMKDFISLLRLRSELLDEHKSPPRIEIVWGAGLEDEEAEKEKAFKLRIEVPMIEEKTEKNKEAEKDVETTEVMD